MKKIIICTLSLCLAGMLLGCTAPVPAAPEPGNPTPTANVITPLTGSVARETAPERNLLSVSGMGVFVAKADVVTMNIGISTRGRDAKKTQSDNSAKINTLVEALKAAGIEEKDIQTSGLNLYPQYSYANGQTTLTGYECANTLLITINDVSMAGSVVDQVTQAGVNQGYNLNFTLKDDTAAYQQALQLAVEKAQQKAQALAAAAGVELIGPVSIIEGTSYSAAEAATYSRKDAMPEAAMDATPVIAGDLKITANVTLQYEIVAP